MTDGRFHPGDKISVEELTRELGVSRSPIWAAINRLAAEGIVEVRPRDGVFLAGFDRNHLVVECDGGQHAENDRDLVRDAWFAGQGFRTLRFWNNDVLANPEGVLMAVLQALGRTEY